MFGGWKFYITVCQTEEGKQLYHVTFHFLSIKLVNYKDLPLRNSSHWSAVPPHWMPTWMLKQNFPKKNFVCSLTINRITYCIPPIFLYLSARWHDISAHNGLVCTVIPQTESKKCHNKLKSYLVLRCQRKENHIAWGNGVWWEIITELASLWRQSVWYRQLFICLSTVPCTCIL